MKNPMLVYRLKMFAKCYSPPMSDILRDSAIALYEYDLSPFEKVVFEAVRLTDHETSATVGDILNMRSSQASNLLKDLHDYGYLDRKEETQESGGSIFVYSIRKY